MGISEGNSSEFPSPPLVSLNHVSFLCTSVGESVKFYQEVLGFQPIRRPSSFDFEGAWLYNYGIGIHLLQRSCKSNAVAKSSAINPNDDHISFQCSNMEMVRKKLGTMGLRYVIAVVKEGPIEVEQIFFHDPDDNMIEICDCQKLPIVPLSSSSPPSHPTTLLESRSIQKF